MCVCDSTIILWRETHAPHGDGVILCTLRTSLWGNEKMWQYLELPFVGVIIWVFDHCSYKVTGHKIINIYIYIYIGDLKCDVNVHQNGEHTYTGIPRNRGPILIPYDVRERGEERGLPPSFSHLFSLSHHKMIHQDFKVDTWLILPVVICLSQRLSHACPSINLYTVKLRMAH